MSSFTTRAKREASNTAWSATRHEALGRAFSEELRILKRRSIKIQSLPDLTVLSLAANMGAMKKAHSIHAAKTQLSRLVEQVERGDEVISLAGKRRSRV